MSQEPTFRAMLLGHAHAVLSEAILKPQGSPQRVEVGDDAVMVVLRVIPRERPGPTPCETDVLALLAETPHPLRAHEVLSGLDRTDRLHGESTVRKTLARLIKEGKVINSRRAPRGYRLAPPAAALNSPQASGAPLSRAGEGMAAERRRGKMPRVN